MATHPEKPEVTDVKLVRRAQRGDMPSFEELVARHRDKIYARAFSMMRNEDEAVDLSQEAWVKAWQRLKQFQGESSFVTWMTRIVINLRSEEHTSELQSQSNLVCRLLLEKKNAEGKEYVTVGLYISKTSVKVIMHEG